MERSHTEERIDQLGEKVDRGFEVVDRRFVEVDQRFARVEGEIRDFRIETGRKFDKVDGRLDKVNEEFIAVRREMKEGFESQRRLMVQGLIAMTAAIVGGFGVVAGLIAAVH